MQMLVWPGEVKVRVNDPAVTGKPGTSTRRIMRNIAGTITRLKRNEDFKGIV